MRKLRKLCLAASILLTATMLVALAGYVWGRLTNQHFYHLRPTNSWRNLVKEFNEDNSPTGWSEPLLDSISRRIGFRNPGRESMPAVLNPNDPAAVPVLQDLSHDEDEAVRDCASQTLVEMYFRGLQPFSVVLAGLEDKSALVRAHVIELLGLYGRTAVENALVLPSITDDSPKVREAAEKNICESMNPGEAVLLLARGLKHQNPGIRQAAAEILAKLDSGQEGASPIGETLRNQDDAVSCAALEALKEFRLIRKPH
jgi:HEAT repeat protein